eukprot:snap_masked-scaffold1_size3401120-processed-gene-20.1 protein:Tk04913 transcript:snap_masked-scaffold1_size3401120-processed-gene-20.1-mRNA-1 annotation:"adenylyltransferase"
MPVVVHDPIPELFVSTESTQKLKSRAAELPSWDLTPRQLCDLELLMNGGFYPLRGFHSKADYDSVLSDMRLEDGSLWPMPITLDVSEAFADTIDTQQDIALRDQEGVILAILTISDKWQPDKSLEASAVFGADDLAHPAVNYLHNTAGPIYLGGSITGLQAPTHYDYRGRRDTPNELRALFRKWGWRRIVAFQTRNPLHRAHQELTFRAARDAQANLLIHPIVGLSKPGDIDHFTRVRCYEAVLDQYPSSTTALSLLNLAMRMGGPREAVWHGLIRKNHGCTHFIVGRDHAGPGLSGSGKSTVANAVMVKLMELGGRPATLLDGDIVRKNLSSELGFSKEHRDLNIRRIGYVASEITKNGGVAICAPIAPYSATRRAVREDIEQHGAFVEVHVATSLEECERRDRKGLYQLARAGKIKEFTGISDPYEAPDSPELRLDTENVDVDACAHQVILKLESLGLISA